MSTIRHDRTGDLVETDDEPSNVVPFRRPGDVDAALDRHPAGTRRCPHGIPGGAVRHTADGGLLCGLCDYSARQGGDAA